MVAGFRLGIDFGTSNTVAVLRWPDGHTRVLLFDGAPLLPSAVYADPGGTILTGRDAIQSMRLEPHRFEPYPKRRLADGAVWLGDREVPAVDLVTAVLRRVAVEAGRVAGTTPDGVTMTHPVAWGATRRAALSRAATAAGLPEPLLVGEPVAAAWYFTEAAGARVPDGAYAVIYDLGAGTFDATVVRRTAAGFEIVASEGASDLGGLDVDAILVGRIGTALTTRDPARWQRLGQPETPADRRAAWQLWEETRLAKEMLSRSATAHVHVPIFDDSVPVGREELEQYARPLLDRTIEVTRRAVRAATGDRPAAIFLVGGSSRIPLVATLLHRAFQVAPTALEQPELVVAEGALHLAAPIGPGPAPIGPGPGFASAAPMSAGAAEAPTPTGAAEAPMPVVDPLPGPWSGFPDRPPSAPWSSPPATEPVSPAPPMSQSWPAAPVTSAPPPLPAPADPGRRRAVLLGVLAAVVVLALAVSTVGYLVYRNRGDDDKAGPGTGGPSTGGPSTGASTPRADAFAAGTTMRRLNEARRIAIGIKNDQPGFGYREAGGRPTGFEVEIGRMVAAELGVPEAGIDWVETPSVAREQSIESAAVDMVIATYTINEARKQKVDFAGPYYTAGQRLLVRAGNPAAITEAESLRTGNRKVCSVTGSTPANNIRQYLADASQQLVVFDAYQKCVDALLAGAVDAVTTDNTILIGFLSRYPGQLQLVGRPLTAEQYGIGLRKGDTAFRNWLNDVLARIVTDGRYAKAWRDTAGAWDPVVPTPPPIVRY